MTTKLIIFDCDGVLVDSERLACRVLRDMLNEPGGKLTTEEVIRVFKGKTLAEHPALAKQHFGLELPPTFNEIYHQTILDTFRAELQPIPGIQTVLSSLTIPFCVASNSKRERVELSLAAAHLKPFFGERVFTVDDVQHGKPSPDLFLLAAERLNTAPANTVVVEDSLTGVAAAIAAGMRVFGFADLTSAEALHSAGVTAVFTKMADLPALLMKD